MKPVLLKKFRPNKRQIAMMWGNEPRAEKTTQKRSSFFSNSSHGGYVTIPKDLTEDERKLLGEPSYTLRVLVGGRGGEKYVLGCSYMHTKSRSYSYSIYYSNVSWQDYPVYVHEEDDAWLELTYTTNVDIVELVNKRGVLSKEVLIEKLNEFDCHSAFLERALSTN